MKKSLKLISLLLAMTFLLSGTLMIAYAEGEDDIEPDPVYSEPGDDPVYSEPWDDPEPVYSEPGDDPEPVDSEPDYDPNAGGIVDNGETGIDTDNSYVYDPDPLFYGDASDYDYNSYSSDGAAGSVTSQTTLYNSSGMTAAEAAPNEWSEITLDEKTVKTGVADFSAIKSNTETTDNGDWILWLGYALIGLAVLGILYFIIATVAARKANKRAERIERRRAASASSPSPSRSTAARMVENERRSAPTAPRTSRYAEEAPGYSRRRASKADTGQVYIPRRTAKRTR